MTNENQTAMEQLMYAAETVKRELQENGSWESRYKSLAATYSQEHQERLKLLTENAKLRMEMTRLNKEREMLWKTVDRMEREKSEMDRYSITQIVATRGNRAALQIIDGKTGKIGLVAIEITADGKVRGIG
ncbi:MAG: hypothetical protein IJ206_09300 [Oscillospiraceae bacterium]|nr:hypothetical protein [Oscillospiraceae bacterium]